MTFTVPRTWKIPADQRPPAETPIDASTFRALYATHLLQRAREPRMRRYRVMLHAAVFLTLEAQGDIHPHAIDWLPEDQAVTYLESWNLRVTPNGVEVINPGH
jgi:hypothetical protein